MEKAVSRKSVVDLLGRKRVLFLIMATICTIILAVNLEGRDNTILVGNLLYIPVTLFMVASSFILLRKQRKIEDKDIGWVLFFVATIAWLLAEHIWMVTELVLHGKTFPSAADFFYIGGYILMGTFIFRMLWPLKGYISFKIKFLATLVASVFFVPTILAAYSGGNVDPPSLVLSLAYPIMDGILLWPGIVVLCSSFKIESGKFWILLSIGVISLLIGDTLFSYFTLTDGYYTGYPGEVFFYGAYVMFGYAALTRAKQSLSHRPLIEEIRETFQGRVAKSRFSMWKMLLIFSTSLVIMFFILMLEPAFTERLTTNQLETINPIGYVISCFIIIPIVIMSFSIKKSRQLQKEIRNEQPRSKTDARLTESEKVVNVVQQLIHMQEKRQDIMMPFWVSLIVALAVVSTFAITSVVSNTETQNGVIPSGRYLIQNLQGETIETAVSWDVSPDQTLHVTIVNAHSIGVNKLKAIEDAILSRDITVVKNQQTGRTPITGSSVYYNGWAGALESIHQQNSSMRIPTNFDISQGDKAVGDIIIILSTDSDSDGALGFTKSISDSGNHQLLKSFITIFDVRNLSDKQLSDVTRHEFGHALGLWHSTDPNDLMSPQFHENLAYISPCDVEALKSIYAGNNSTQFTCTK